MYKKIALIALVMIFLIGCEREKNNENDDSNEPTQPATSEPARLSPTAIPLTPVVLQTSLPNDLALPTSLPENSPTTSLLMVLDESVSVRNCSFDQQKLRHSVPEFYLAFNQTVPNQDLRIAISTFNADDYYKPVISFEQGYKNSIDWFQEIEELKLSNNSGEDYSTLFKEGLQDLKSTSAKNQILLLLTDGIYNQNMDVVEDAINNNIDYDKQKIYIVLLCPDAKQPDDGFWEDLDADKDSVSIFRTDSKNWFRDLTDKVLVNYLEFPAYTKGWMVANEDVSFDMPGDYNFRVTAISLFQGNIGIEPDRRNLNQYIVPNSFYYYQEAEPNSNCEPSHTRIINYTKEDVFFWVNKEKLDVKLSTEFVSLPNEKPVRLATIMTVPNKSNSDLMNLLSCYKPEVRVENNQESLEMIHPTDGYCLDGWCAEPSRLVSYWTWRNPSPPIIKSFSILNRKTSDVIYTANADDLVSPPFLYEFSVDGPLSLGNNSEPYLVVDFLVWSSRLDIQNIEIRAFTNLSSEELSAVSRQRTQQSDAPLCPLPGTEGYYKVQAGELSKDCQIIKGPYSPDSADTDFFHHYFIKIFRSTGWHFAEDLDPPGLKHCGYDRFRLIWNNRIWECNMVEKRCYLVPNIENP